MVSLKNDILQRFDLSGKVAVITGAGGDLCGAMAEGLGAMGVSVAMLDINLEKAEIRARSVIGSRGTAKAFCCDVLNAGQVESCYGEITKLWGPPDFLINGAGGNNPKGSTGHSFFEPGAPPESALRSFFDLDLDGIRQVFDLNFMGTFIASRVFSKGMIEKGNGAIINVSSMSAFAPLTRVPAYSAAKAAVSNFTQWLAVHLSHTGVRVNALAPGFFMTEQLKFLHIDSVTGELTPRAREVIGHTPLGRYGVPDDLIGTVVWLLSNASSFVTGVVVPIDGGFSSYSI